MHPEEDLNSNKSIIFVFPQSTVQIKHNKKHCTICRFQSCFYSQTFMFVEQLRAVFMRWYIFFLMKLLSPLNNNANNLSLPRESQRKNICGGKKLTIKIHNLAFATDWNTSKGHRVDTPPLIRHSIAELFCV